MAALVDRHPTAETLKRFMLGELERIESRDVVKHLVRDCPVCRAATSEVLRSDAEVQSARPGSWSSAREQFRYDTVLRRAFSRAHEASTRVARERREAVGQLAKLLKHPVHQQLLLVRNSSSLSTWSLCDRLIVEGWNRRSEDPRRSCELARLAVEVAHRVDPETYGPALVEDLRARAWIGLSNAHRLLSDFASAESALRQAVGHLAAGSGNPVERAWLFSIQSSLRSSQHRDEEAEALLNRAIAIYRRAGDRHALGRTLIQKGMVRSFLDDPEAEIVLVREGLKLIDVEAEPRLVVIAWHNLVDALNLLGQHREALNLLRRARPFYLRLGDRIMLIRFQWLEGTLAVALGRSDQAEGCLREARRAFIDHGLPMEVALVSLDLAGLLVEQRRHTEVRELAVETIPILRARQIHAAALSAMVLFQQAAERERLSAALLRKITETLRQEPTAKPAPRSGG